MRYCRAEIEEDEEQLIYRSYTADLLRNICVVFAGKDWECPPRYYELIQKDPAQGEASEQDAGEIINNLKEQLHGITNS